MVLVTRYIVLEVKSMTGVLSTPTVPTMLRVFEPTMLVIGIDVMPADGFVKFTLQRTPPLTALLSALNA